jgi:serine/threonine protein phosphatase 1
MPERLAVIGDVHGDARRLTKILHEVGSRKTVLVGDYIDRGPQARQVLDVLVEERSRRGDRLVLLLGNHERLLLNWLDGGSFAPYAMAGGIPTIRSYIERANSDVREQVRRALPANHEALLRDHLETYYEDEEVLISHTGIDPDHPQDRREETVVMSAHPSLFNHVAARFPKFVVCGHYVQSTGLPWITPSLACVDTGCGTRDGSLTALLLPERRYIQV